MFQVILLVVSAVVVETTAYSGKVLLISMDGFRWDYLNTISGLDNFERLRHDACSVDYVNNVFATKTFPCHYSIVTGLYEESHGIVANHMYDPVRNATFGMASKESFWWDGGEPVWVTAEKQGIKTGVFFWPGSEAEIRGYRPSIYREYNQSFPFEERVETALGWFSDNGAQLVLLYFHEPDLTGHKYGPRSLQMDAKVREMDAILGQVLNTLKSKNLDDVNVILTADHGMTEIDMDTRLIDLWDYVDPSLVKMIPDSGPVTAILPHEGQLERVLEALGKIDHVTAYRKKDIPQHFHYSNNPRIMPIIAIADEGWTLAKNYSYSKTHEGKGNHGYNNRLPSMKPIFFAWGPDFNKGVNSTSISSLDIYPLICRLLDIHPAPNNGTLASTSRFLRVQSPSSASGSLGSPGVIAVFLVATLAIFTM